MSENVQKAPRKRCSICGEEIHAKAIKCIHCGEFLKGHTGWSWSSWFGFKHRSLWDIMSLILVPLILLSMGFLLNRFEEDRRSHIQATDRAVAVVATEAAKGTREVEATVSAAETTEAISAAKATEVIRAAEAAKDLIANESTATAAANRTAEAIATVNAESVQATISAAYAGGVANVEAQIQATTDALDTQATISAAKTAEAKSAAEALATANAVEALRATEAAEAIRAAEASATANAILTAEAVATVDAVNAQATIAAAQAESMATAQAQATADALSAEATIIAAKTAEAISAAEATAAVATAQAESAARATQTAQAEAAAHATQTVEACFYAGPVKATWERYKDRLHCPKATKNPPYAWQRFENGDVFWSAPLNLYVIANNSGQWRRILGEQLPDPQPNCPEEGLPVPVTGAMARLWCSTEGAGLGAPTLVEQNGGIAFQDFDNGLIWRNEARNEDYILFEGDKSYLFENYQ